MDKGKDKAKCWLKAKGRAARHREGKRWRVLWGKAATRQRGEG